MPRECARASAHVDVGMWRCVRLFGSYEAKHSRWQHTAVSNTGEDANWSAPGSLELSVQNQLLRTASSEQLQTTRTASAPVTLLPSHLQFSLRQEIRKVLLLLLFAAVAALCMRFLDHTLTKKFLRKYLLTAQVVFSYYTM